MKRVCLVLFCLLLPTLALAQSPVVSPRLVSFVQNANDIAVTTVVHLDAYQCPSLTDCSIIPLTPVGAGVDVPSALVTTLSAPDASGNNRTISMVSAPVTGYLSTLTPGVSYALTLIAKGDPAAGIGVSARSAASNPFFSNPRVLLVLTNPKVTP